MSMCSGMIKQLRYAILYLWLTNTVGGAPASPPSGNAFLQFDAIVELNAPLCRTHVLLFARYWVSRESYRAAVVWAEPSKGGLNFPVYPPTLNVTSDPNHFALSHQLQYMYNGVFSKPLGIRGPFRHRFNSYCLSDIRFAEQEALDLRICVSEVDFIERNHDRDCDRVVDLSRKIHDSRQNGGPIQLKIRTTDGHVSVLQLLDADAALLKSMEYEYGGTGKQRLLRNERIILPERPITVGFSGKGPVITVAGKTQRYSELEVLHHEGGRQCMVDYDAIRMGQRSVSLPTRIRVFSGDGKQLLRSARLYNYTERLLTAEQFEEDAERYSGFDANAMSCRELLLKYWMRPHQEITPADVNALRALRTRYEGICPGDLSVGEQLKRINTLVQLGWMLDDPVQLEGDFGDYLSVLSRDHLDRMILFGGQNVIETTIRSGQLDTGDRLLPLWLDAAVSQNDPNSLLDFASNSLCGRRFWTANKLMESALSSSSISMNQRFLAVAYRCLALSGIYEMVNDVDHNLRTELDIAQARWVLAHHSPESLLAQCKASLNTAHQAWARIAQPTRGHRMVKAQLDSMEERVIGSRSAGNEEEAQRTR